MNHPPPTAAELAEGGELLATARLDQIEAYCDETMRVHTANRQLVDALLDVVNLIRGRHSHRLVNP
jgi:hypothetical protein